MEQADVLIVGAGPGGLAAAKGAKAAGAERVIILERDSRPGGILNQCVHDGFGLVRYQQQLTGPEYAVQAEREAEESEAELLCGHHVVSITPDHVVTAISPDGLKEICAKAIVLATGCRERTRGAIAIPGSRPAGVFTAGVVQNFVNLKNIMPGRRVVILGSGDVGMIMARRLTLEGSDVVAVIEVLPEPAGLSRNVSQCLYDYGIPIYCGHTVSKIIGKKKLEAIEMSQLDDCGNVVPGTERVIECDALVLSVGLIPENEVAQTAGVALDAGSNGVMTDSCMQTSVPGIFSCGNSRRIMDLADYVSEQGELAGWNAAVYAASCDRQRPGGEMSDGEERGCEKRDNETPDCEMRDCEMSDLGMRTWEEARSTPMAKGFPQPNTVTCSLCPKGCQIRFDEETGTYEGNGCKRGIAFAEQERLDPKRFLTTTIKVAAEDGYDPEASAVLLPVRSDVPISLKRLPSAVKELQSVTVARPIPCGSVVATISDGEGNPVSILACADCV